MNNVDFLKNIFLKYLENNKKPDSLGFESFEKPGHFYEETEYNYKLAASKKMHELFDPWVKADIKSLTENEFINALDALLKGKLPGLNFSQNLTNWMDHQALFTDILSDDERISEFMTLLHSLLQAGTGREAISESLDQFLNWMEKIDAPANLSKAIPSLLLFFWNPNRFIFIKPSILDKFLEAIGENPLGHGVKMTAEMYSQVLNIMEKLKIELAEFKPKDMIDLQSFYYLTMVVGEEIEGVNEIGKTFLELMEKYNEQKIVFRSAEKGASYYIRSVSVTGCITERLDANEPATCTASNLVKKIKQLKSSGGEGVFAKFIETAAIRNTYLQVNELALSPDKKKIIDVSDKDVALDLFCELLVSLNVDRTQGEPRIFKPAMLACVVEGIETGELLENKITFDWIAPRFIAKMEELGQKVTESQAAMPFYHLTSELFWMLAYYNVQNRIHDGNEGPSAVRNKVSHAVIKDTFWEVLQDEIGRKRCFEELEKAWWPAAMGGRNIWWVNLGKTFSVAISENFIWAPLKTKDGRIQPHWESMLDVKPSDIIVAYSENYIRGVGIVLSKAIDTDRPSSLQGEEWHLKGRKIVVEFHQLNPIIGKNKFVDELFTLEINNGPINIKREIKEGYLWNFSIDGLRIIQEAQPETEWPDFARIIGRNWIFQAKHGFYDVDSAVRDLKQISWTVSQYKDQIHKGDKVFIWESGPQAGICASATVLDEPDDRQEFGEELKYWLKEGHSNEKLIRVSLNIDKTPNERLLKTRLKRHPDLENLSILRRSYGTNFPVTMQEALIIREMLMEAPQPQKNLSEVSRQFAADLLKSHISFGSRHNEIVRSFVASLATKRLAILTGLSGSGKTQIAIKFGEWLGKDRLLVIPVRPDWTGPEPLFGYEDALQPCSDDGRHAWHVPDALEFMLEAVKDPDYPYLLLLDEMNLAHVERYFADYLSGMESEYECLPNLTKEDGLWRPVNEGKEKLPIPDNLFVVGTVNIDETTYMFSPKVLDRGNTFEFVVSTEDLNEDAKKPISCEPGNLGLVRGFLEIARDGGWQEQNPSKDQDGFTGHLKKIHSLLAKEGFEFGHRTFYEAIRFASMLSSTGDDDIMSALDLQIMQKVLPKLHGSRRKLEGLLCSVGKFCFSLESDGDGGTGNRFNPEEYNPKDAQLPTSFDKVKRMTKSLRANQFTSFTE